jgi:DUF1680 family protein
MYNFKVAAGMLKGEHKGPVFQDSDLGKWIEAVGHVLSWHPDKELEKTADEAIDIVCAAQQPDGYLNTYYSITDITKRWTNLMDNHELYCLGHILEGAIAYYEATGKDKLLNAMIRYVDLVDKNIGSEPGKIHGYPGHEVIEMALIKLHDITRNERHLELAKYFIDQRGKEPLYFKEECEKYGNNFLFKGGPYGFNHYQAGKPVREQHDAQGHAVRAVYLYGGMADLARKTGDAGLLASCQELWRSVTERQMYITGSIGSSAYGEAFSYDYDLPNDRAYAETCATIGLIFFARRMLENIPDSQYADVMERALYNGVISGISLDGKRFFYVNPLEARPEASQKDFSKNHVKVERQKWFTCACCPPNLARLLASLKNYVFTAFDDAATETDGGALFMHLYIGGQFKCTLPSGSVTTVVETKYPWDGKVTITVNPKVPAAFTYALRIPGWCSRYVLEVNGIAVSEALEKGYIKLRREWKAGDRITVNFEMPVTAVMASPSVRDDIGKVAVTRGPIVYCLEEVDNGPNLQLLSLGEAPKFQVLHKANLLEGVTLITGTGRVLDAEWSGGDNLYAPAEPPITHSRQLTWIPYYAWANRGPGEMQVWLRR